MPNNPLSFLTIKRIALIAPSAYTARENVSCTIIMRSFPVSMTIACSPSDRPSRKECTFTSPLTRSPPLPTTTLPKFRSFTMPFAIDNAVPLGESNFFE